MNNTNISKHVILNFFEGKTTPMQNILIKEWLENPENRELYFQWMDEWEIENPQFTPNVDNAFLRSLIPSESEISNQSSASKFNKSFRLFTPWIGAAAILFVIGYFLSDKTMYKTYQTSYGEIRTIVLQDSSKVTLNANSTLRTPRFGFGSGNREVMLEGEAEFVVKHTVNHNKFIVRTPDQLEIKVLGTEFVVYARDKASKVALTHGSVQLKSNSFSNSLIMKPGDVVTMSKGRFVSIHHNERMSPHLAWKQRRFMFENTPVSEIAFQISKHFGVKVVVADTTLAKRTLGGTFNANDPAKVLKVLGDVLNAHVNRTTSNDTETFIIETNH